MKRIVYFQLFACFFLLLFFVIRKDANNLTIQNLRLLSLDGSEEVTFQSDNVHLIHFFSSWCTKCKEREFEYLNILRQHNKGMKIFGVNWKDSPEKARKLLDSIKAKKSANSLPYDKVARSYKGEVDFLGVNGVPETIVLDGDNKIIAVIKGPLSKEDLVGISILFHRDIAE